MRNVVTDESIEIVNDALVYINLTNNINKNFYNDQKKKLGLAKGSLDFNNVGIKSFDGAQVVKFDINAFDMDLLKEHDDGYFIFNEDISPEVVWPIDIRTVWRYVDDKYNEERDSFIFKRIRSVDSAERKRLIGTIPIRPTKMLAIESCVANGKASVNFTTRNYAGWIGGKWVSYFDEPWKYNAKFYKSSYKINEREVYVEDAALARFAMGLALTNRYFWKVKIGYDGFVKLSFITDATGVREIFRDREKPEGKDRKSILLHWVKMHWRQNRHNIQDDIFVRKHLRANTVFRWNGLQCEIMPSEFDIELNERLKKERQEMRG